MAPITQIASALKLREFFIETRNAPRYAEEGNLSRIDSIWGISFLTHSPFRHSFFTRAKMPERKEKNERSSFRIRPVIAGVAASGQRFCCSKYNGRTYVFIVSSSKLLRQTTRATQRRTEIAARREE